MTLSIAELSAAVAKRFPNVEKVSDSAIRFTRVSEKNPFAVYYMDIGEELPATPESLTQYQDQIIGKRYFEDRQSLQWSNYLYFIISKDRLATNEARRAKELIEGDRKYARKFVISEDELERVLEPPSVVPLPAVRQTNILSVWTNRLVETGLDGAIISEEDLPRRLSRIESATESTPSKALAPHPTASGKAAPFITSLSLHRYREFPLLHLFNFGTVNLIHGANATGKTSLLEAIELFYCGRNKRNPDKRQEYELTAVHADGRTEKATNRRKLQEFRRRHLDWYGQAEVKTNELYLSFAQFNFLDTDAAVRLSESTATIDDDLSKLLVGPETSKIWRNIEKVLEALVAQLRNLRPLESQLKNDLKDLEAHLAKAASVKRESDAIRAHLEQVLSHLKWATPKGESDEVASRLIVISSELAAKASQAEKISWALSPVSMDGLAKYCRMARDHVSKADVEIQNLEKSVANQRRLNGALTRNREVLNLLMQVRTFITAGLPERVTERTRQQAIFAVATNLLTGFEESFLGAIKKEDPRASVRSCQRASASTCTASEKELAAKRREYQNFISLRDESVKLQQQLREIATTLLKSSDSPDECPLCHTRFKPGELAKHMQEGIGGHFERKGQSLLAQIRQQEELCQNATKRDMALTWLAKFCENADLRSDVSVRSALASLESARRRLMQARHQLDTLTKDLEALEVQGYPIDTYQTLQIRLSEVIKTENPDSAATIDKAISTIENDIRVGSDDLRTEVTKKTKLVESLRQILSVKEDDISAFKRALSDLSERIAATESIYSALSNLLRSQPWPVVRPLAELRVTAESVRQIAVELQTAVGKEKIERAAYDSSRARKDQIVKQLVSIQPKIKHYERARSVLADLQKNHSLTDAMKSSLAKNRSAIEAIFARIHAPPEFLGLGSSWATLERESNGAEVSLSEISTGQRAAFGLSVFLAQNSQLTVAPPVILIDDPIAHVDDLNSLSFLDYLREIALTGRRQIFFATASDKLATLFERKFDFLGSKEFRRFNLTREAQTSSQTKSMH